MKHPWASKEPLELIRANECEADPESLATSRFRALWNEIERLRAENAELKRSATIAADGGCEEVRIESRPNGTILICQGPVGKREQIIEVTPMQAGAISTVLRTL